MRRVTARDSRSDLYRSCSDGDSVLIACRLERLQAIKSLPRPRSYPASRQAVCFKHASVSSSEFFVNLDMYAPTRLETSAPVQPGDRLRIEIHYGLREW